MTRGICRSTRKLTANEPDADAIPAWSMRD